MNEQKKNEDLEAELFITKKCAAHFYQELERLQPALYNKDTLAEREVFKCSEFIRLSSLKSEKQRNGKYEPKRIMFIDALWKACNVFPGAKTISLILKEGKDGLEFLKFNDRYTRWRSNKQNK